MGRNTREQAAELTAVTALVAPGDGQRFVGSCTLVTNGATTIGFASADLLRAAPDKLAIALTLDGKRTLEVARWIQGRAAGIGIIELAQPFPAGERSDVVPLNIGAVCATVDTRGAPSALVGVVSSGGKLSRRVVPVHVDAVDGGGMSDDVLSRLASPIDAGDVDAPAEGYALFSWLPPDPVLGRGSEVVAVALAIAYGTRTFKPRELPAIAELVGLEDLGRALPYDPQPKPEASNELGQVAGEIKDIASGPL
ncbi:MAG: hypothetical protein ACM31C_31935, partial [Acidobacteriota bacterium]